MRGVASYLLAGIFVVLALDFMAPPAGLGTAIRAWPGANATTSVIQSVGRTNKGDRMPSTTFGKRQAPRTTPSMLAGCEPVFSPLSASARANFAGRCIA